MPESTVKKKCNIVVYYAIQKSVGMGESLMGYIRSEDNASGLLTEVVAEQKRKHLVSIVLYDMYDVET